MWLWREFSCLAANKMGVYFEIDNESEKVIRIKCAEEKYLTPIEISAEILKALCERVKSQKDHLNSEILNESMEIREYLLDCDDLQFAGRMIDEKVKDCTKSLINAFATKNFDEATTQVLRLKYLYKSFEEVKKNATNSNF